MDMIFFAILCTVISMAVAAVVAFLAAKYVNSESRWPGDIVQTSGRGPHLHPVDENRRTVGVDVFAPCRYVDRLTRRYEDWAEAFVKANLAAAINDATAEVVESADGNGNLAYVRDAHGRCPDLLFYLPKGTTLVKVGAGKFRLVVAPVTSDLPNGPERTDAGHDGTGGGNGGDEKPDNLK